MSIELISKDACGIEIERKGNRIDILLVENEPVDQQVIVRAEERIEFLTPWINMLIHHKKEAGLKGTKHLARKLYRMARFEKGKHEEGFLTLESINTEIISLRKEIREEKAGMEKKKEKMKEFKIVQKRLFQPKRRFCHSGYYTLLRTANKAD